MSKSGQKLHLVAKTDVGRVREHNEDNFIVTDFISDQWLVPRGEYHNSPKGTVMVIADGMGGLNAGEVASRIAVDSIMEYYNQPGEPGGAKPLEGLEGAILSAHRQILSYGKANPETEGMGTTVVLAHIKDNTIYVSWSGDSRGYLYRNGHLSQLTRDHSYVQTLLDEGKITNEQAFYHPNSNIITQSLGDQVRPPEPGSTSEKLYKDDVILLCSDGLNAMLPDEAMEEIIRENENDLPACLDKLIAAANEAGGNDNITVIMTKVTEGEKPKQIPVKNNEPAPKKNRLPLNLILFLLFIAGVLSWYYLYHKKPEPPTLNPPTDESPKDSSNVEGKMDERPSAQPRDSGQGNPEDGKKTEKENPEKNPEKGAPVDMATKKVWEASQGKPKPDPPGQPLQEELTRIKEESEIKEKRDSSASKTDNTGNKPTSKIPEEI